MVELKYYFFKILAKDGTKLIGTAVCAEQDLEDELLRVVEQAGVDPIEYTATEVESTKFIII